MTAISRPLALFFTVSLAMLLAGCPFVGGEVYQDRVRDMDGDGFDAKRFGGPDCADDNAAVNPAATEVWYDGVDQNCDGLDDFDQDADGVGRDTDCDDLDPRVAPDADELCDGIDNDCDGLTDDNDTLAEAVLATWFLDADGDAFGAGPAVRSCVAPPSHVSTPGDCDDTNAAIAPDALESCDAADRNCDGDPFAGSIDTVAHYPDADGDGLGDGSEPVATLSCEAPAGFVSNNLDCDDSDAQASDPSTAWYEDFDGDGFGSDATAVEACLAPPGTVAVGGDCNDAVASIRPGAPETCNSQDDDCDGTADEGAIDAGTFFLDGDGDGFGVQEVIACTPSPGVAFEGGDCDDANPLVRPGATEICGDGVLQDCNVSIDDCDGDGDLDATDCDDEDPAINATAPEVCDGFDNDCDGAVDGADDNVIVSDVQYFLDADGDGFGSNTLVGAPGCTPPPNSVTQVGDCDDDNASVFPGRTERCDGLDNDCNGLVDDGQPADPPTFYRDADGDGFGVLDEPFAQGCEPPDAFWSEQPGDCDDQRVTVNPAVDEVCDDLDNDCDGLVDADDDGVQLTTWFLDQDGDGAGINTQTLESCDRPNGYAPTAGDCDDTDPSQLGTLVWFRDADGDGRGDDDDTLTQCAQPVGYIGTGGDCDDTDPLVSPSALEVCDGVDNDCDGGVDDDDPQGSAGDTPWFRDVDQDGFGDFSDVRFACLPPPGFVASNTDCDDALSAVNPGAVELCNGEDDDCDLVVDDNAPPDTQGFVDIDQDGFGADSRPVLWCSFDGIPTFTAVAGGDCNDAVDTVRPDAIEVCDGLDNDCSGSVDDDPTDGVLFKADRDGDGNPSTDDVLACSAGFDVALGFDVLDDPGAAYDCDDDDPTIFVGAPELCDGIDNDCAPGGVDENPAPGQIIAFVDGDGDGFGDPAQPVQVCLSVIPAGIVLNNDDCNDVDDRVVSVGQSLFVGPSRPFGTIQSAVDAACDSQEIVVSSGTFSESVTVDHPIRLVGSTGGPPTEIDGGSGPALHFVDAGVGPTSVEALTLLSDGDGLVLDDSDASLGGLVIQASGTALRVEGTSEVGLFDSHMVGFGTGIETHDTARVDASLCTVQDVQRGLRAFGSSEIVADELELFRAGFAVLADDDASVELRRSSVLEGGGGTFANGDFGGGGVIHARGNGQISLVQSEVSYNQAILPPLGFFSPFGTVVFISGGSVTVHQTVFAANGTEVFAGSSGTLDVTYSTFATPSNFARPLFALPAAVTGSVETSIVVDGSSSGADGGGVVFDDNLYDGFDYGGPAIVADPMFWRGHPGCDERWDLHVLKGSPAADVGPDLYGYTAGPDNPEGDWNAVSVSGASAVETGWSLFFFGAVGRNGLSDDDADGLIDRDEVLAGTDPTLADTDGDGIDDPFDTADCAY